MASVSNEAEPCKADAREKGITSLSDDTTSIQTEDERSSHDVDDLCRQVENVSLDKRIPTSSGTSVNMSTTPSATSLPSAVSSSEASDMGDGVGVWNEPSPQPKTGATAKAFNDVDVSLHVDLDQLANADEEVNLSVEDKRMSAAMCSPSPDLSVYHIKWIKWKDNKTAIITQNENGPCPLIAIMNVLILKGKVHLPPMIEMITAGQLMDYLGDCILEYTPKNISEGAQLNYQQNMHDAMAVLPKLQTGLDVNVKFTGVQDFEYTTECIIFDLLNIPLYHGWLVDPQLLDVVATVGNLSYNQLVERIITDKTSPNPDVVTDALIAEGFLERTASQLTYHGLCELNAAIQEDEVCVLFRNNHFSTIYKHKNELFQLVTDQGFLTESSVVWETLSSIDGDGQFVDCNFKNVPPKSLAAAGAAGAAGGGGCPSSPSSAAAAAAAAAAAGVPSTQQIDQDEELARRLQMEEQTQHQASPQRSRQQSSASAGGGAAAAGAAAGSTARHQENKKKSDCTIL